MLLTTTKRLLKSELKHLLTMTRSSRPWHLPIVSATATGFPVFVGAYFDALSSGIKASLGAMIILNLPLVGSLSYRLVTMMAWGFAMSLFFALGALAQQIPILKLPVFTIMTFGVVIFGRYYQQSPPAGLFVMMAGAMALFIPIPSTELLSATGLVLLGSSFSMIVALLYSLFLVVTRPKLPAPHCGYKPDIISESVIVTGFVSFALLIAVLLNMPYPYWASVSCFIIIQGIQLRTMWVKQLHRLLGTAIGVGLATWVLSFGLVGWEVAIVVFVMMICIEALIDRHYGLAVVFITPLTIFIAEYSSGLAVSTQNYQAVIQARLIDTVLGCLIGLSGGIALHSNALYKPIRRLEGWLIARFG